MTDKVISTQDSQGYNKHAQRRLRITHFIWLCLWTVERNRSSRKKPTQIPQNDHDTHLATVQTHDKT